MFTTTAIRIYFASLTLIMQIAVHRQILLEKNVDFEFPDDCLFGHPFYFGYHDFIS